MAGFVFWSSAGFVAAQTVEINGHRRLPQLTEQFDFDGRDNIFPLPAYWSTSEHQSTTIIDGGGNVDAQRVWGNTGTDFNANASWTAGSGGLAPVAGDVAAFNAAAVTNPILSAGTSIAGVYFSGTGASGYTLSATSPFTLTLTASGTAIGAETGDTNSVAIGAENTTLSNTISAPIILAPSSGSTSTIFQAAGGSLTLSGVISGTGKILSFTGGGTLTLSGVNTYSGGTNILNGTVNINNASALGTGTATLGLASSSNSASLILQISGTAVTVSNAITTASSDTGTLKLGSSGGNKLATYSGLITLNSNLSLTAGSGGLALTNTISGTGGLITTDNRTYTISGTNSYSGGTTIANGATVIVTTLADAGKNGNLGTGSITLGSNPALGTITTGTLSYAGKTGSSTKAINIAGNAVIDTTTATGPLTLSGTFTVTGADNRTLTLMGSSASIGNTISSVIGDGSGGGLTSVVINAAGGTGKNASPGAWALSGASTYTGGTTLSAGTLQLGSSTVGSPGSITSGPLGKGTVTLNAGTLSSNSTTARTLANAITFGGNVTLGDATNTGALTLSGAGTLTGSRTLTINSAVTYSGVIGESGGSFSLTKAGTSTLTLSGVNTYTGGTVISAGTLTIAGSGTLGATTGGLTMSGGLLDLGGTSRTVGAVSITAAPATGNTIQNGSLTGTSYSASNTTGNAIVSANLLGSGVALTKSGAGILTLSGTNNYTGTTTINGGILDFAKRVSLYNANTASWTDTNLIVASGATAAFNVGGSGEFTSTDFDTLKTLGTATGGFENGSLIGLDTTNAGGNFTLSSALANTNGGANSIGLVKLGTGTLTLGAVNTYTGATVVNGGTLKLGVASALPTDTALTLSSVLASNTATLDLNGFNATISSLTLGGSTTTSGATIISSVAGTPTLTLDGDVTYNATNNPAGATIASSGGLNLGSATRTFNIGDSTTVLATAAELTISAIISGDPGVGLTKTGAGTLLLSAVNTYTGPTTVNAGTLRLGVNSALPNTAVTVSGTAAGTTTLDLAGFNATIASLTLGGGTTTSVATVTTGAGTLTLGGDVTYDATNNPLGATISGNLSLGSATRTFNIGDSTSTAAELTISANVSGSGGLTKTGAGALVLSGANSYGGATTINGGTLEFVKRVSLYNGITSNWTDTNIIVASGATAAFYVSSLGTGEFTSSDIDILKGLGTNTGGFESGSFLGLDTTNAGVSGFTYSSDITDTNGGANSLGITKLGTGILTLSGNNTYTGGTNINGGTLALGSAGAIGSTGTISFGGGTLQYSLSNTTDYSPRFSTAANQLYSIDTNGVDVTFASALTSSGGSLTKLGLGSLTLSAANTYSGGTTLSAGQLNINNASAIGTGAFTINGGTIDNTSGSAITLSTNNAVIWGGSFTFGGTNDLNFGTGAVTLSSNNPSNRTITLNGLGSTLTFGGTVTNTSDADRTLTVSGAGNTLSLGGFSIAPSTTTARTLTIAGTGNVNITGAVVNGGTTNNILTYSGSGTLILSGANTYTGGTNINGGEVQVASTENAGVSGPLGQSGIISFGGGALQYSATNQFDYSSRFSQAINQAYKIDTNGQNVSFATALTSTGGSLTKLGTGTLTLNAANTYTGSTTVNNGTLQLGLDSALPGGAVIVSATSSTATLDLNGFNQTISTLTFGGATNTSADIVTSSTGTPTLTLGGDVTYSATNNPLGATISLINLDLGSATRTFNIGDSTSTTAELTISAVVIGSNGLTKTGAGILVLSGANTYTGGTNINGGELQVAAAENAGTSGPLGQSGIISFGGGTLQYSASNTFDYSSRFSQDASQAYSVDTNGQSVTFASVLTSSAGSLTKLGAGTLTVSAANTYDAGTTVSGGTLAVSGSGTLGATTGALNMSGGSLDLGGTSQTVGAVNITAAPGSGDTIQNGNLTGTSYLATNTTGNATVSANLGGSGVTLIQSGAGTLTLTGTNTYTGATTVNAGTLIVGVGGVGSLTSDIIVNAGTLGGTGSTTGTITIGTGSGPGAFIAPGNSVGTFTTTSSLSIANDGVYVMELNSDTATADKIVANGISLASASTISFTGLGSTTLAPGTSFVILDNTSGAAISGTFSDLADGQFVTFGSNTFQANYEGGDGNDLILSVVPEHSTWAMFAFGAVLLFAVQRFRLARR